MNPGDTVTSKNGTRFKVAKVYKNGKIYLHAPVHPATLLGPYTEESLAGYGASVKQKRQGRERDER
jgi:hypothetical protein